MQRGEYMISIYNSRRINSNNMNNNLNFNTRQNFTENNPSNKNLSNRNYITTKSRPSKLIIIIISSISFIAIVAFIIPIVILKGGDTEELPLLPCTDKPDNNEPNVEPPPIISIEEINPKKYCIYSTLKNKMYKSRILSRN